MQSPYLVEERKRFAYWARKAGKYDLARCSSGNLSHRLNDDTLLVSESRSWLSNLRANQVTLINLIDNSVVEGKKPSGELPLHLAVMSNRKDVKTILHCQSPAATTLACQNINHIDYNVIIEIPIYIGNIKHVPFIMPGSQALADAVANASKEADIIQMTNHGQVIIGNDYEEVIQKAVFFELACNIILNNRLNHISLNSQNIDVLKNYR